METVLSFEAHSPRGTDSNTSGPVLGWAQTRSRGPGAAGSARSCRSAGQVQDAFDDEVHTDHHKSGNERLAPVTADPALDLEQHPSGGLGFQRVGRQGDLYGDQHDGDHDEQLEPIREARVRGGDVLHRREIAPRGRVRMAPVKNTARGRAPRRARLPGRLFLGSGGGGPTPDQPRGHQHGCPEPDLKASASAPRVAVAEARAFEDGEHEHPDDEQGGRRPSEERQPKLHGPVGGEEKGDGQ